MKLTEAESEIVAKVVKDGYPISEITQTTTEFRVYWRTSGACGSRALVYDLRAAIKETINEISHREASLYGKVCPND